MRRSGDIAGFLRVSEMEPNMLMATDERLSAGEAARQLGRSKQRVLQLIQTGRLPATRTMIGYLIDPIEVSRLLQERATVTTLVTDHHV